MKDMSEDFDFDKYWLRVFSMCLEDEINEEIRCKIMEGSENISSKTSREEVFQWTKNALSKLDSLVDNEIRDKILTGCACQYPRKNLRELKNFYAETKDLVMTHQKLQEFFETFLDTLNIEDKYKDEIIKRNMGMAGRLEGKTIIATKIPKSAFIKDWFEESDSLKKRSLFCHCPRIRDVMGKEENELPMFHCYCGAGFYKVIWEEILQKPVKVEVLETVMNGGDVCKIAVYLPE
jgi:hypothetical protein